MYCKALKSIDLPAGLTSIDQSAFFYCSSLESIEIPEGVTSIGDGAFMYDYALSSVTLPSTLETISSDAFYLCKLDSVTLPDSVTSVGSRAFASVTSITLGTGITDISFLQDCGSLKTVNVPADSPNFYVDKSGLILSADQTVLLLCPTGLEGAVTIPATVTSIGDGAFANCTKVTEVYIPASVTSIGKDVFQSCYQLQAITVAGGNANYTSDAHGVLFTKDMKTLMVYPGSDESTGYTIPNGVTSIANYAFCNSFNLTTVTIPDTVTSIGDWAFYGSEIETITLPDSLTSIGEYAFAGTDLETVTIPTGVTELSTCMFHDCYYLKEAYVLGKITKAEIPFNICDKLERIYFAASEEDLDGIIIDEHGNNRLGADYAQIIYDYVPGSTPPAADEPSQDDSGTDKPSADAPSTDEPSTDEPAAPAVNFTDVVADAYYADAVQWAVASGVTNGYGGPDTFAPDIACTRGQIVTFLYRANGSPEPKSTVNPFTDVAETDFFYKAVLWAVENDITAGYGSDTIFNPNGECTRAQVATFIWRAAGQPAPGSSANPFTDVPEAYYTSAVLWAVEQGITKGYGSDTVYAPDITCTRGQIVTFLFRAIG